MRTTYGTVLLLLGACGGGGDTTIDIVHDVCAPPALTARVASPMQLAAIEASQELWRDRGAPALGRTADVQGVLEIEFRAAAGPFWGEYDDEQGVIYINDAISDPTVLSIVIAHELGHSFGLVHVDPGIRRSLMNPANSVTPPTEEDQRDVERLWGVCAPAASPQ